MHLINQNNNLLTIGKIYLDNVPRVCVGRFINEKLNYMYEFEKHTKLTEFIQEMANTGKVPREWSSFIETLNIALGKTNVRRSLPITNQKLWEMSKEITDKLRNAKTMPTDKVDWDLCQELWFDWLEEELFGNEA